MKFRQRVFFLILERMAKHNTTKKREDVTRASQIPAKSRQDIITSTVMQRYNCGRYGFVFPYSVYRGQQDGEMDNQGGTSSE